jgi:heme-degrading monooxygenase HmoA
VALEVYTSGNWIAKEGMEDELIARWGALIDWTKAQLPGRFRFATLIQQKDDPRHFISFGEWDSAESVDAWRSNPDFAAKLGACREVCDEFVASDYLKVAG